MKVYVLVFIATVALSFVNNVDGSKNAVLDSDDHISLRRERSVSSLINKLIDDAIKLENEFNKSEKSKDKKNVVKKIQPLTKKIQNAYLKGLEDFEKKKIDELVKQVPKKGDVPNSLLEQILDGAQAALDRAKKLAKDLNDNKLKNSAKALENAVKKLSEGKGDTKKLVKTVGKDIDDAINKAKKTINNIFGELESVQKNLVKRPDNKEALKKYKNLNEKLDKLKEDLTE